MIQLLHDAGYRNAAGLSSVDDDEWKDYKVPKSVQKAIKKVLASNSSGGGGGMGGSSEMDTRSGSDDSNSSTTRITPQQHPEPVRKINGNSLVT